MARIARCVVPDVPHHVTQRGNRRQTTFFSPDDYATYKSLLRESCARHRVRVWAYCLLPNHVHFILQPSTPASLWKAVGWTHQRYAWRINRRMNWSGHLWQGRFWSCPMDERHTYVAARYILLNPVLAGYVARARDWPHSSAAAHLGKRHDELVDVAPLAALIGSWSSLLSHAGRPEETSKLLRHARAGLPLGDPSFVETIATASGRPLALRPPGRPAKTPSA